MQDNNLPLHRALGLSDPEFKQINELLEREPNDFELAVFSLLWSEHCGYKHSALLLKRLPSEGPDVLQGPGENAGVVSSGDGLAVAFKVESHNHPSAVAAFQGAATGVGGILRDIVAMGARPVALLDSLRFGELTEPRQRWLFSNAVAGIGNYGNCVGVANVGGECVFDAAYRDNCLVNAMCVGLLPIERLTRSQATGTGNRIVLYGASTGRDGIGGASVLASQELSDGDLDKRPSVQIGDPFTGKKLIEASLELVEAGLVVSLQDLGAAGLASSVSEMAAKSGAGVDLQLDDVPLREAGMSAAEIMISESQERMVAIVEPAFVDDVAAVCEKWDLHHAVIGTVTGTGVLRCLFGEQEVGAIPAHLLTDAPRYWVETREREIPPSRPREARDATPDQLLALLASANVASRAWVFRQYDQLVQSRTVRRPGLGAAVLRLRPSFRGLALSLDGAGRLAACGPQAGGALAVMEAARNVACTGGAPLALTNCLNFGNPEKPEIAWELEQAIEGMALACEALGVPIVSGNVSLYNETDGMPIHPTPVVGCVGLVEDVRCVPGEWAEGDVVLIVGDPELQLDGSQYEALFLDGAPGAIAWPDLIAEAALVRALSQLGGVVSHSHDAAEGGIAVALVESALHSGVGAELDLGWDAEELFGEGGGRAVVACAPDRVSRVEETGVPIRQIGVAGGESVCDIELPELRVAYSGGLERALRGD